MKGNESVFTLEGYKFSKETKEASFSYLIDHKNEHFTFTEKLVFPQAVDLQTIPGQILNNALEAVHIVLGISYWKLFCPGKLVLRNITLSESQAKFWNTVYTLGLGEIFYKNQLDFRDL